MKCDAMHKIEPNVKLEHQVPRKSSGVVAVERALGILDAFLGLPESRGLSELARATELPKPTVLRSLVSMERMGYVIRLANGRYQLGAKLLQLADSYCANFKLEEHVLPLLRQLAQLTGESAVFQIREQDRRLVLFRVESQQTVRDVQPERLPVPLDEAAVSHVLRTGNWEEDQRRGRPVVFYTAGVGNPQTASMASAVFGVGGELRGAMNISGPVERLRIADLDTLARHVAEVAGRLSQALGAPLRQVSGPPELIQPNLIRPDLARPDLTRLDLNQLTSTRP